MAADTMSGAVVVTGAAGALGKAVVARLAREDLPVVALDVADAARLPAEAAHAIGGVDAGDETAANDAFREIGQRFGSIRGLVNVVGGFAWETIADGSVATWVRLYLLNVRTTPNAPRAALPQLATPGPHLTTRRTSGR